MSRLSSPSRILGCLLPVSLVLAFTLGCGEHQAAAPEKVLRVGFTDVAAEEGITHRHSKPILDHQLDSIMSWMTSVGAAVAAGDYDNDGWVDLYVTNSNRGEPNYLYRNTGGGSGPAFTEVAPAAGLAAVNGDDGASMDAVWGDYDNDGWIDLYLVRWGRDSLYRNNGADADGNVTFTEVTADHFRRRDGKPGIDWTNGNAAIFFDYDLDGRLDIYVGNYFREVDLWNLDDTRIMHDDFETARNGGDNFLFHQQSDGTFVEKAVELGLEDPGWTLAVGSADVDNDGWPDLYCANDFGPDQLFVGNGAGADGIVTFANVSDTAIGYDTKKGMNIDFGDFNNDGWLDGYVTNITTAEYLQEGNMLWYNLGTDQDGNVSMTDVSLETGTDDGGWGWGGKFLDYDNDGDLDILAVNGFISAGEGNYWYDLASWTVLGQDAAEALNWPAIGDRSFSGYEKTRLWRNDDLSIFTEQAAELGIDSDRDGRGVAVFDYDNDGDQDVFIANQGQEPHLFRNNLSGGGHWLGVILETDAECRSNRDGIGARVTLVRDGGILIRERDGGNGYSGQSDPRLHFGLGDDKRIDLLEVRWPDGGYQYVEDVAADRWMTARQDPSRYRDRIDIDLEDPAWSPSGRVAEAEEPKLDPEIVNGQLAEMEDRLRAGFDRSLASTYRSLAAGQERHDRAIAFFEGLVEERGEVRATESASIAVELSLAYVDKIPACGGLAAIVCKGSLAKKGLDQLDQVLAEHPDSWLAFYSRGMNHLHWPRALRHSDDAAADLEHCVEAQESDGEQHPYYLKTHVALGQAYAKAGRYDQARQAWQRGLEAFPDSAELHDHLAIEDDGALLDYVQDKRSLETSIDTDVSFYEQAI